AAWTIVWLGLRACALLIVAGFVLSIARNLSCSRNGKGHLLAGGNVMSHENAHTFLVSSAGKLRGVAFEVHALRQHHDDIFHWCDDLRLEREASRIGKVITHLKARLSRPNWENEGIVIFAACGHRS